MARFEEAVRFVLSNEGGYVNDKDDPGGETMHGISKRSYPHLDIKHLTVDQAKRIFHEDFWQKNNYGEIMSQDLATKILDMAVNMGPVNAHKAVQTACNVVLNLKLPVDGILGKRTLNALNDAFAIDMDLELYRAMCHYQANYYESIGHKKFLRGWLLRAFS